MSFLTAAVPAPSRVANCSLRGRNIKLNSARMDGHARMIDARETDVQWGLYFAVDPEK